MLLCAVCVVGVCVVGVCVVGVFMVRVCGGCLCSGRLHGGCVHAGIPEHHHVQGIVGDGGDQSCQRDDEDGRNEEVWAAVWTRAWASLALAPGYTHTLSVQLHHQEENNEQDLIAPQLHLLADPSERTPAGRRLCTRDSGTSLS